MTDNASEATSDQHLTESHHAASDTPAIAAESIPAGAIVTVTPNPCLDRTASVSSELKRGGVNRLADISSVAAGKGINVALATLRAKEPTVAIAPCSPGDQFGQLVADAGLAFVPTAAPGGVRINLAVLEADGTTTKLNEPGNELSPEQVKDLNETIVRAAASAEWIVLGGSLPPGLDPHWFATIVRSIKESTANSHSGPKIAVDTSDNPLYTLGQKINEDESFAPDLLKPNGLEIGQILGIDGEEIEHKANQGDFSLAADAARTLVDRGVNNVLLTLGKAGAVLATAEGAWSATPPPITPVSTVGAGDSSLAGFLIASRASKDAEQALRFAVAYGTAATALPGTTLPYPEQTHPESVEVVRIL